MAKTPVKKYIRKVNRLTDSYQKASPKIKRTVRKVESNMLASAKKSRSADIKKGTKTKKAVARARNKGV